MRFFDCNIGVQGKREDPRLDDGVIPDLLSHEKENSIPPRKQGSDLVSRRSLKKEESGVSSNNNVIGKATIPTVGGNGKVKEATAFQLFEKTHLKDVLRRAGAHPPVAFEKLGDRWEVAVSLSDGSAQHVSFVNGIRAATTTTTTTTKGGGGNQCGYHYHHWHAPIYIADQIAAHLVQAISEKTKRRRITIHASQVTKHLCVFVNCLDDTLDVANPSTRDYCIPVSPPKLSNKFLNKVGHALAFELFMNARRLKTKTGRIA